MLLDNVYCNLNKAKSNCILYIYKTFYKNIAVMFKPYRIKKILVYKALRIEISINIKTKKHQSFVALMPLMLVEHKRFELLTPTMPLWCATNCANAP